MRPEGEYSPSAVREGVVALVVCLAIAVVGGCKRSHADISRAPRREPASPGFGLGDGGRGPTPGGGSEAGASHTGGAHVGGADGSGGQAGASHTGGAHAGGTGGDGGPGEGGTVSEAPCTGAELDIANGDVRACDLLLDVGDTPVDTVTFSKHAMGAFLQRPPKLAISVITRDDVPFRPGAVCLAGDSLPAPEMTKATCYDRLGWPVEQPGVVLP